MIMSYQDSLQEWLIKHITHRKNKKEEELLAKEAKDAMVEIMEENGIDDIVVDGTDALYRLTITFPEREVLNKKGLAEELGITLKELNRPENIIMLTRLGKLTEEMVQKYTIIEERQTFNAKEAQDDSDDE